MAGATRRKFRNIPGTFSETFPQKVSEKETQNKTEQKPNINRNRNKNENKIKTKQTQKQKLKKSKIIHTNLKKSTRISKHQPTSKKSTTIRKFVLTKTNSIKNTVETTTGRSWIGTQNTHNELKWKKDMSCFSRNAFFLKKQKKRLRQH